MISEDTDARIATVSEQCLSVRLRMLNRMVNSIYDKAMRPYRVKSSQMHILVAVARTGETTSKELCARLHMDTSTFSRALTILRNNSYLASSPSGDGKILKIRITREGLDKVDEVFPAWQQAQREAAELLGAPAVEAIRAAGTNQLKLKSEE